MADFNLEGNEYFEIKSFEMTDESLDPTDDLQRCTDDQLSFMTDKSQTKFANAYCYKEDKTVQSNWLYGQSVNPMIAFVQCKNATRVSSRRNLQDKPSDHAQRNLQGFLRSDCEAALVSTR
jgi:hypothetical protein